MSNLLSGKIAVVTGSSRGIGRAIALLLAENGADVAVNYASSQKKAEEVVAAIEKQGRSGLAVQADVARSDEASAMIEKVQNELGSPDILVNNAGITRDSLLLRMEEKEWEEVLQTNLKGVYNCTKAVVRPMLKQRRGCIVNISSVVGQIGNPGQANYAAAKAGIVGFTRSVARELASRQIRVNAVAPGYITTDMTEGLSDKARERLLEQIPFGRLGEPEDVAEAVLFLASDQASYITGQVVNVDGGMVMQ